MQQIRVALNLFQSPSTTLPIEITTYPIFTAESLPLQPSSSNHYASYRKKVGVEIVAFVIVVPIVELVWKKNVAMKIVVAAEEVIVEW